MWCCCPWALLQARNSFTQAVAASYAAVLQVPPSQVVIQQLHCDKKAYLATDQTVGLWLNTLRQQNNMSTMACAPSDAGSTCKAAQTVGTSRKFPAKKG